MILKKRSCQKRVCEILQLRLDPDTYDTSIDGFSATNVVNPTLAKFLSTISKNVLPNEYLPNVLIGNMVAKFVGKKYTHLLINLAVMIRKNISVSMGLRALTTR